MTSGRSADDEGGWAGPPVPTDVLDDFAPCPGTGTGRAARPSGPAPSFETEQRLDLIAELTNGQLDPEDAL